MRSLIFIGLRPDATRNAVDAKRDAIKQAATRHPDGECRFFSYELRRERDAFQVIFHDHNRNIRHARGSIHYLDVHGSISNFYEWVQSHGSFDEEIVWLVSVGSVGSVGTCTSARVSNEITQPSPVADLRRCEVLEQDNKITPGELATLLAGKTRGFLFLDACLMASIESVYSASLRWDHLVASASWFDTQNMRQDSWLEYLATTGSLDSKHLCELILSDLSLQASLCNSRGFEHDSHHGIAIHTDSRMRDLVVKYRQFISSIVGSALFENAFAASKHTSPPYTFDVFSLLCHLSVSDQPAVRDESASILLGFRAMVVGSFSVSRNPPPIRFRLLSDVIPSTQRSKER